ncbi:sensor histidine kinase [Pedobacter fastidiosus]|uniref:Sensor histidine kinase n=1 Tax=Pedobacter fastidiosus TaxID=2765361 RepID=A0ABR7KSR0_9SPHI|nr:sensor histidine kinase [Pedobacter fastidiosus]MBC6111146.1 sensor histidine kinase [Pedobacter fastidiosus]
MTSLTKDKKSGMLKLFLKYKIHFIAWALYITWETFIAGLISGKFGSFPNYVIHYFLNITLFYVHAYLMAKALHFPKNVIWKLPLYIALEILAYVVIVFYIDSFINAYTNIFQGIKIPPNKIRIFALLWRCLFFVFFSTGYYYLITYLSEKKEKERIDKQRFKVLLEKERTEKQLALARNALLQAQINPHLLFNTLEFLYQKLKTISPNDAQAMLYLSEVMRYAASADGTKTFLSLGREIAQCENLISLHGITEGKIFTGFAYAPDVEDLPFIPLVLVTVLENMFKHGDLQSDLVRAELSVYQDDDALVIESINAIRAYPHRAGLSSGLNNIKNRLEYAYGSQATFLHQNDDKTFRLTIRVEKKAIIISEKGKMEILQKKRID